MNELIMVNAVC